MTKIKEWIDQGTWREGIIPTLHNSVDKEQFYAQYKANPRLWDQVFKFFKETDMKTLAPGTYEIDGKNAYASVSDYQTKEPQDAIWESHIKYIDLQYVITGKERMGIMSLKKAMAPTEYDESKDLIFYQDGEGDYAEATPAIYFLFFPEDVHRPSMKIDNPTAVRKMVIKIAVAE